MDRIERMQEMARSRHEKDRLRFIEWIDNCETPEDLIKKAPFGTEWLVISAIERARKVKAMIKFNAIMRTVGYKISRTQWDKLYPKSKVVRYQHIDYRPPERFLENLFRSIKRASQIQIKRESQLNQTRGQQVMLIMFGAYGMPPEAQQQQIAHVTWQFKTHASLPDVIVHMVNEMYSSGNVNRVNFWLNQVGYKVEDRYLHKLKKHIDGWRDGWLSLS